MFRSLFVFVIAVLAAPLQAEPVQVQLVRLDAGSALTAVVKHFGWLEAAGLQVEWAKAGQVADFAVAQDQAAIAARAAGKPVKAIYVVSRAVAGDAAQYLVVAEGLLAQRGEEARVVLANLERARHWINADPAAAEALVGAVVRDHNFSGSRPGPAQLASLKKLARANGLDEQVGAALLDDSAYRAALTQPRPERLAALSRP